MNQVGTARERSLALAKRAAAVMPGGISSNFRVASADRFYDSARGSRLVDVDGSEVVDYVLGMGVAILGHSPLTILDAVAAASKNMQCPAGQQEAEVELAEQIVNLVPSAELVRLGCTGSEMVQLALRLVRAATARNVVVKFEGHYHGWLDNIFAGTAAMPERSGRFEPPPPQSAGQMPAALGDLVVLPWNDLAALQEFFDARGNEVAGAIMEPICCNTSVIAPQPGFLEAVLETAHRSGALVIFDEVITGFRFAPGGAQEWLRLTPDLTVLGKALGGGYPVSALAGRSELMQLIGEGTVMHGGTYNANAMAVAAAGAALRTIASPDEALHAHLDATACELAEGLRKLESSLCKGLAVQRCGPMINTTFDVAAPIVDLRSYQASNLEKQQRFLRLIEEEGARVTSRGTWFLSHAHSAEDLEQSLDAAERALARL